MNLNINKKLAIVDIDGTLIRGQSQQMLIQYLYENKIVTTTFYLRLQLWFVLYKIGLLKDNQKIFSFAVSFLKGRTVKKFNTICKDFFDSIVVDTIYPRSKNLIETLHNDGYTILLLSTSIEPLVSLFARFFNADDFICTKLENSGAIYSGRLEGEPVYGLTKLKLLKKYCQEKNVDLSAAVAYADHETDLSILKSVGKGYVVNPSSRMLAIAQKQGLDILYLS